MERISVFCACIAFCSSAWAQDLVLAIAQIGDGTGTVIDGGSIVVANGRIVSIIEGEPEVTLNQIAPLVVMRQRSALECYSGRRVLAGSGPSI